MSIIQNKKTGQPVNNKTNRKGILFRIVTLIWIVIISTILIFTFAIIPFQRELLINRLGSEAKSVVTSIEQVTATAIITEDYSFVVDHCIKVVKDRSAILYVVITRKDGFSLIHAGGQWKSKQLNGLWKPILTLPIKGKFIKSNLVNKELFHYTSPFSYSGIDWGWIHIGLSLDKFYTDLKVVYNRTLWLAILCISIGLIISFLFARRLTKPVQLLNQIIERVGTGDLSARIDISTGDEIESLANSFNKMTEELQKITVSRDKLENEIKGRKRAEDGLIESESRLSSILSSMVDFLFAFDKEGRFTFYSAPKIEDLLLNPEEFMGKKHNDVMPKSLHKKFDDAVIKNKKGQVAEYEYSIEINEQEKWFSAKLSPIMHKGEFNGSAAIVRDITESKKLQEQLIHSEKLSATGQLASGVAHDFNNILQIIRGKCEVILLKRKKKGLQLPEEVVNEINVIIGQSDRGKEIIKNLLTFSKPKKAKKEICYVENVIDEILVLQKNHVLLENIAIYRNYTPTRPVYIDEGQIEQVFSNLVINARHAIMPIGNGKIIISIKEINENVEIKFSDNGIGIEKKNIDKIFTPFFTTKGAYAKDDLKIKGVGLGLSVTFTIIQNHNGTIFVESEKGKGTTFTITLPIAKFDKSEVEEIKTIVKKIEADKIQELKILVVDDEKEVLNIFYDLLEIFDHKITTANTGKKALEDFEKDKYDAVFLDIIMPGISGIEISKKMKSIDKNIPIIFITGKLEDDTKDIIKSTGAFTLIKKPVGYSEINKILNDIIEQKKKVIT